MQDSQHSDGNEEIAMGERYVVMPWNVVTRDDVNMTLEEIKKREEERRLASEFEDKHKDEINELQGIIDYIEDEGYIKEKFPELYNFGLGRLGIHFSAFREYSPDFLRNQYSQLDYFKKVIKAYQGLDADADKYVEKVKAFIDKPLD